jgi:hypothetical protein
VSNREHDVHIAPRLHAEPGVADAGDVPDVGGEAAAEDCENRQRYAQGEVAGSVLVVAALTAIPAHISTRRSIGIAPLAQLATASTDVTTQAPMDARLVVVGADRNR